MTASAKAASFLTVLSLVLLIAAAPVSAGILDTTGTPFDGTWSGSTSFSNSNGLDGHVDWIVLDQGDFSAAYPDASYSPPTDHLTYVYQVFNTGDHVISSFSLPVFNPADNIGNFEDAGVGVSGGIPSGESLTSGPTGTALWDFSGALIVGGNSTGLVFSSPNTPMEIFSTIVDGGTQANALPVPTPSDEPIPEPSTVVLMMLGMMVSLVPGARRRRRKA